MTILWLWGSAKQAHIALAVPIQPSTLPFPLNSGTAENKCLALIRRNPALRPYFALGWLFTVGEVSVWWSDSSDDDVSGTVRRLLMRECL